METASKDIPLSSLLQAIAISAGILIYSNNHNNNQGKEAYNFLQNFRNAANDSVHHIRLCLQILLAPGARGDNHSLNVNDSNHILTVLDHNGNRMDVTVSAKLFALLVLKKYVEVKYKTNALSAMDAQQLRSAVLEGARLAAMESLSICNNASKFNEIKLVGSKIAELLANLACRDFPQRWTTFWDDLLVIWNVDGESGNSINYCLGAQICIECLRVLTEDCTDSDFNSKVRMQFILLKKWCVWILFDWLIFKIHLCYGM